MVQYYQDKFLIVFYFVMKKIFGSLIGLVFVFSVFSFGGFQNNFISFETKVVMAQTKADGVAIKDKGIVPCGTSTTPECTIDHFFVLIANITNFLIAAAGAFAVFMIIISGFKMVTSAGDQAQLTKAKSGLTNALIGFVLVMIAYAAVHTLVYDALGFKMSISPFGVESKDAKK